MTEKSVAILWATHWTVRAPGLWLSATSEWAQDPKNTLYCYPSEASWFSLLLLEWSLEAGMDWSCYWNRGVWTQKHQYRHTKDVSLMRNLRLQNLKTGRWEVAKWLSPRVPWSCLENSQRTLRSGTNSWLGSTQNCSIQLTWHYLDTLRVPGLSQVGGCSTDSHSLAHLLIYFRSLKCQT